MFVKHPMSEKLTRSCSGELVCMPRVPMSLPLMLHPITICFVGYDGTFSMGNSKIYQRIEQIKILEFKYSVDCIE